MKKRLLWGGALLGMLTAVVALLWVPTIKRVVIDLPENSPVQARQLAPILVQYEGMHFLQLPMEEVQQRLKQHPWVASAEVRRIWPGTLVVHVRPQMPVARWGDKGLVNGTGEVFFPSDVKAYADLLPLWSENTEDAPKLLALAQWLIQQTQFMGWHLADVRLHGGGSLETHWMPQRTIWMNMDQAKAQFGRFLLAWPKVKPELREKAAELDLRYSNGFTVK